MTHGELIIETCEEEGLPIREWREMEDGPEAVLGRARVIEDDEEEGVFVGEEGELTCCTVGAASLGNLRPSFALYIKDRSGPVEVPIENVELI